MNKSVVLCIMFILIGTPLIADDSPWHSFGIKYLAGIRYDDVRMCVASDPGVKGGPIGDIQLSLSYTIGSDYDLVFSLPVGRPILFAAAFDMLQFEPDMVLTRHLKPRSESGLILGLGLGLSLHRGPSFEADMDNRGLIFSASGPFITGLVGWEQHVEGKGKRMFGLKAFYVPFISDNDGPDGKSYGVALEFTTYF